MNNYPPELYREICIYYGQVQRCVEEKKEEKYLKPIRNFPQIGGRNMV